MQSLNISMCILNNKRVMLNIDIIILVQIQLHCNYQIYQNQKLNLQQQKKKIMKTILLEQIKVWRIVRRNVATIRKRMIICNMNQLLHQKKRKMQFKIDQNQQGGKIYWFDLEMKILMMNMKTKQQKTLIVYQRKQINCQKLLLYHKKRMILLMQ